MNRHNSPNKKFKKDEELKEVKPSKVYTERRRSGKLTINQALSDQGGRQRSIASLRRRQEKVKRRQTSENIEREKDNIYIIYYIKYKRSRHYGCEVLYIYNFLQLFLC